MAGNFTGISFLAEESARFWTQPIWTDWRLLVISVIISYAVYEQLSFFGKRGSLPGPTISIPFIGSIVTMITDPTKYWNDQATAAVKTGMSWNSLIGKYIVFIRDSEISQRVFANVHPQGFRLIGHPLGKKLFGDHNMIMMMGDEHKDLRRRLAPLFTLKALGVYVDIQEKTIRHHIKKWQEASKDSQEPVQMRVLLRDMNLETSQTVFVGPYLGDLERQQFTKDYHLFNVGLLALPINLPGFAFWKATRAVQRIIATLANCAQLSKINVEQGAEPQCLLDFWMVETVREIKEAKEANLPPPPNSSNLEVGQHLFDFLFAAQDASTSSLVWSITQLESHPKVLAQLRAELAEKHPDSANPYSPELLRKLTYTEQVMKEVLRFRPPATMVPHIAAVDFPLTADYTVPKGSIVFPSILESSFQGFTDPHQFDPDRFSPERREDQLYRRNWLLFGAGPHQCLGQRYAMNHIMLFLALLCSSMKWQRVRTPGCDDLLYVPTIIPRDGARVHLQPLMH